MKRTIYLRIDEKVLATLKEISIAEKRSMSNIVGLFVTEGLAEVEKRKDAHANRN